MMTPSTSAPAVSHIGVELGLSLHLRFDGFDASYRSRLVGLDKGKCLICSVPLIPGVWSIVNSPDRTTVRYLHDGVVYGFRTTLLRIIEEQHLLILAYPVSVESVNLRRHERVPCMIPATASLPEGMRQGMLLDISAGGCSFSFMVLDGDETEAREGDEVPISNPITEGEGGGAATIIVGSVRKSGHKIVIGGAFKSLSTSAKVAVERYMEMALAVV